MAYLLYKYIRNKRREKRAREANSTSGLHSDSDDTSPTLRQTEVKEQLPPEELYHIGSWTVKRSLVHNIVLMVALAFPVYLETLDYTGMCNTLCEDCIQLKLVLVQLLQLLNPSSPLTSIA